MELWEFNQCVREFNCIQQEQTRYDTAQAWKTANFAGAAVHGKLKNLSEYLTENHIKKSPKITFEEFDQKLAQAEQRGGALDA